jgi:hypothetical protein
MSRQITIVISSRKSPEENINLINQIKETCSIPAKVLCIENDNAMGLSELYSQMMVSNEIESKIVVFCHDDIEFLKPGWGKEIIRLFNKHRDYGIIGVAGSAEFDENCAWWNYKRKFGQVIHKQDGTSWLSAFSPLLDKDLEQVCVIDGLFMAFNREKISKNFDPNIPGFNFYDIDVCLANFFDGKCKIGVTTNVRLAHKSVGKPSEEWFKNRELIIKKYGKYFPIRI